MTGMKEGAGENPFADDESSEQTTSTQSSASPAEQAQPVQSEDRANDREQRQIQIPYKFRRDGVQDGRERVPLFLQPETKRGEREAQRELEERLDEDVSITDLREALMKAGLQHLDEVEGNLEEWGYGMTFTD
ncbi:hypothetical protein [Halorubrum vacuolatum]|uniref:hypothetical protein n=1 Tax=Halorubrum vacuolatum TaxID=63740 RepID=UPI000B7895B8|nr:hypothetical protein [Halorubrum vacuolatum]